MVERTGIEPVTPTMSTWCSPAELTLLILIRLLLTTVFISVKESVESNYNKIITKIFSFKKVISVIKTLQFFK